jgi:hypothetical protein
MCAFSNKNFLKLTPHPKDASLYAKDALAAGIVRLLGPAR